MNLGKYALLFAVSIPVTVDASLLWIEHDTSDFYLYPVMSKGGMRAPIVEFIPLSTKVAFDDLNYYKMRGSYEAGTNEIKARTGSTVSWTDWFFLEENQGDARGIANGNYYGAFTIDNVVGSEIKATVRVTGNSCAGCMYVAVIDTAPLQAQTWDWLVEHSLGRNGTTSHEMTFQTGVPYYVYVYSGTGPVLPTYCEFTCVTDPRTQVEAGVINFDDHVKLSFEFEKELPKIPASYSIQQISAVDAAGRPYTPASINDYGKVVGSLKTRDGQRAFAWSEGIGFSLTQDPYGAFVDINQTGVFGGISGANSLEYYPTVFVGTGPIKYPSVGKVSSISDAGFAVMENAQDGQALWRYSTDRVLRLPFDRGSNTKVNANNLTVGNIGATAHLYDAAAAINGQRPSPVDLGHLGGGQSTSSDINNDGTIVGYSASASGACVRGCAFVYTAVSKMKTLPGLSSQSAWANAINKHGMIVGVAKTGLKENRAVIWNGTAVADLNSLIPATPGLVLKQANDINDVGQIVGTGVADGKNIFFVLTPN